MNDEILKIEPLEMECIEVPKRFIPKGATLVEAYKTSKEIVVIGEPSENHNCDEMGCGTLSHVIYRFPIGGQP